MYSLGQAARAVGKAKSTISRDVKSGKVSAVRNTDGSVSIDPAELHRVYPPMPATEERSMERFATAGERRRNGFGTPDLAAVRAPDSAAGASREGRLARVVIRFIF
jgi:hypothetical protein